ncbi:hypothetical protein [Streptomyces virginiae]|uniref:hypothetical protein n=1 Tax=Streptomyces virginiae TaxID=1961 RepID=UPI00341CF481
MNPSIDPHAQGPNGSAPSAPPSHTAEASSWFAYDVTRYLCAAMHTDSALAREAVSLVLHQPRRAAASSPGLDLACVLRHALAARRLQRRRDIALSLLLAVLLIVVGVLVYQSSTYVVLPSAYGVTLLLGCFIAWMIVAVEMFSTHYRVISRQLKRENFNPRNAPRPRNRKDAARIEEIELRDRGNVVISSGFDPFVGHGGTYSS